MERAGGGTPDVDVVVPTLGRPSLARLLEALGDRARPRRIILVDDRREPSRPLDLGRPVTPVASRIRVLPGPRAGPAAARNVGWRAGTAAWVAFLDDDVVPDAEWWQGLAADLTGAGADVGGSQGRVRVPLPQDRRPTDWERNVRGLEGAPWVTADMAYRRAALEAVGGFDERFRRAYREDVDLALRVQRAGYRLVRGERRVAHSVRPAGPWLSVRLQAGNADDALMLLLHGPGWRGAVGAPRGRRPMHLLTTAAGLMGLAALAVRRRPVAAAGGLMWLAATAELAWRRLAPGPRTAEELGRMLLTTPLLPPVASWHWLAGLARAAAIRDRGRDGWAPAGPEAAKAPAPVATAGTRADVPQAVLLDRDGTLIVDVPYNGDPSRVMPVPGVREALGRLRRAGLPVAVVSNQSGVARGLITPAQVEAVHRRVEDLVGPMDLWLYCPHGPADGCGCRKPEPGQIVRAAESLGVDPRRCAVVGDTAADLGAAAAAGARGILVPNGATRPAEVRSAPELAADLEGAVDRLIGPGRGG